MKLCSVENCHTFSHEDSLQSQTKKGTLKLSFYTKLEKSAPFRTVQISAFFSDSNHRDYYFIQIFGIFWYDGV